MSSRIKKGIASSALLLFLTYAFVWLSGGYYAMGYTASSIGCILLAVAMFLCIQFTYKG